MSCTAIYLPLGIVFLHSAFYYLSTSHLRLPVLTHVLIPSIAAVHAARRHRVLAAQTLRALTKETETLRRVSLILSYSSFFSVYPLGARSFHGLAPFHCGGEGHDFLFGISNDVIPALRSRPRATFTFSFCGAGIEFGGGVSRRA
jgi:hypothetical protein